MRKGKKGRMPGGCVKKQLWELTQGGMFGPLVPSISHAGLPFSGYTVSSCSLQPGFLGNDSQDPILHQVTNFIDWQDTLAVYSVTLA